MAARFSRDPEHLYVILSASAAASSTFSVKNPTATFSEKRNAALLADASKYRVAVTRVVLSGSRGLPIFIPSIQTGQDDPYLTNYKVSLTYTQTRESPPQYPTDGPIQQRLSVTTFRNGSIVSSNEIAVCTTTAGMNVTTWAAAVQYGIQYVGGINGDTILQTMTVTPSTANDGRLVFKAVDSAASFVLECGPGSNAAGQPYAFGFADTPPPPLGPTARVTSTAGTPLTMPLPAYYTGGTVTGSWTGSAFLEWIPQTSQVAPPRSPRDGQAASPAYWTYDYAHFATVLNNAFEQAFLNAATLAAPKGIVSFPPFVTYSRSEKAFVLWSDAQCTPSLTYPEGSLVYDGSSVSEQQTIVFNEMLQNLLMFPATYLPDGTATINTSLSYVEPSPKLSPTDKYVAIHAEASPVASLWSPVASITVSTQLIPSDSTYLSIPQVYGVGGIDNTSIATSSDSQKMLTDFVPIAGDATDINTQSSVYAPLVLRWIDMPCGAGFELSQTDFQLGWRDRVTNVINDIELTPLASAEVLLEFRRADIID